MTMRDPYPLGFKLDNAGRIIDPSASVPCDHPLDAWNATYGRCEACNRQLVPKPEVGITAAACASAGHPPQLAMTRADTQPQPLTCGCGVQHYELRTINGNA